MKKQRLSYRFILISVILLFALALNVSCGSKADAEDANNGYYSGSADGGNKITGSLTSGGIGSIPSTDSSNPNAKVIKTATATISTLSYDDFIDKLYSKINELEGYTDSESFSGSAPYRYAYVVARIPADKLDEFKTELSSLGTLNYYSAEKQDVTLTYNTLVAKIDTLTLEAEALEELFEIAKAEGSTSQISQLQSALYDLRLEINEAKAQLTTYDNSISHSTVKISINEVREYVAPEPEEEKNAFERIGENLTENLTDIWNGIIEFFVWFVSSLPYIIIWGAVITGAVFLIIFIRRRIKNKKGASADSTDEAPVSNDGNGDNGPEINDAQSPDTE